VIPKRLKSPIRYSTGTVGTHAVVVCTAAARDAIVAALDASQYAGISAGMLGQGVAPVAGQSASHYVSSGVLPTELLNFLSGLDVDVYYDQPQTVLDSLGVVITSG